MRILLREVLPAEPEAVWSELADWERYAEWMPDVAWVRALGPGRELGMRLAVRTRVLGMPLVTDTLEVTAWEPPRRMAVAHLGLAGGWGEWLLEPEAAGTTFTWTESLRIPPPLLGELALRVYRPVLERTFRASIRKLAERLASA